MNDRITTFAESLFMFWQYPFLLLWVMGMSGHKIWFYFRTHTHTDLDQKQLAADYTIQSDIYVYLFSLLEAIGISQKNELWGLHRSLSFCKPFYFLQYHTLCTKLCLCGGGYGCTNSIWSEKKEDSAYLALGSYSIQIWKDLLIYSDILQKDWARLVYR